MPTRRVTMRHVREILRLSLEAGLSTRVIGERTGVGATTVRDMLKRFARSGLNWPVPVEMSDADLESCLYGLPGVKPGRRKQPEPDWSAVACELKRKHVTLQVLWEEYIGAHPDGYRYSRWCDLFRHWEGRLPLWSTAGPVRCAMPICLWRCSADRACHLPARRGPSGSPTGSKRTTALSASLAAWLIFWSPITR
ncbi:helix-turn-helix domain-containing protein, partial [Mesorhizobium amorphae]|uniref:helix-turn-helix domain-containing protein n=1 Tax=Mesorhizobium amorphae TaxID=71433 RepID=UPI003137DD62